MKVMLLGGTGYLGANICTKLVNEGVKVICVVRNSSDLRYLDTLGVQFIINEPDAVRLVLQYEKVDWIINCVCTYKVNNSLYGDMLESNILFPLTVLNTAIRCGVNNFLTLGTSLPEQFNFYSFSKGKFSEFGEYICSIDKINFIDLKLEMFYGGINEPSDRFIRHCINRLKNNEPLLLTSGKQKRDIIHVDDIVEIVYRIMQKDSFLGGGYTKLPCGCGESHSIREIVEFLRDKLQSSSEIRYGAIEDRKGEPDTLSDIGWYDDISYKLRYPFFVGLGKECEEIK